MMPRDVLNIAAGAVVVAVATARAHDGPRVWVNALEGRLITQTSDDDYDPSSYSPSQVFRAELSPYFGTFTTHFPGYESPRDGSGAVSGGTWIGFKIAGPLLTPNAGGTRLVPSAERWAGQAAIPQLAINLPDVPPVQAAAYTRRTSTGVVPGYDFTNTIVEHVHLAYTFLGDGTSASAAGPDGAYVLPMVLTSPSLATSRWYFLTFKKGDVEDAAAQAATLAGQMAAARAGDANFDGNVNFDDLLTLAQNYGVAGDAWWARGDFDFDGAVTFDDLLSLAQNYGPPGASLTADSALAQALVPEPGSSLIALAGCWSLRRRRRRPA